MGEVKPATLSKMNWVNVQQSPMAGTETSYNSEMCIVGVPPPPPRIPRETCNRETLRTDTPKQKRENRLWCNAFISNGVSFENGWPTLVSKGSK